MNPNELLPTIDPALIARLVVVAIVGVVAFVGYLLAKGEGL